MRRGEVVIVDVPFTDRSDSKTRPTVIVQSDELNRRLRDTIIAAISTTAHGEITHVLIDPAKEPESGPRFRCGVRCETLHVIQDSLIEGRI